jgi:L-ascorbate metabolism protein UlaG (beta-lactamase superfamily)
LWVSACTQPLVVTVKPAPAQWTPTGLTIAYLGHASMLIDFEGTMLLTDPTFFDRIGVSVGGVTIGPKRRVAAALAPDELPPIDAVLISHAHMDSLDRPSLRAVARSPLVVVPARTRDLVDDLGFARVVELRWGESTVAGGVTIEAVEVSHWGKRWPWEPWRGYNGYLLSKGDVRVLFASDTAYTEAIGRLGRERRITAAILGNGAYDPWIMNHASPEQAWRMFEESGACFLLPCHWDTFRLGKEPIGEAIARLVAAAGPEADRIVIREIGASWTMPPGGCARE